MFSPDYSVYGIRDEAYERLKEYREKFDKMGILQKTPKSTLETSSILKKDGAEGLKCTDDPIVVLLANNIKNNLIDIDCVSNKRRQAVLSRLKLDGDFNTGLAMGV